MNVALPVEQPILAEKVDFFSLSIEELGQVLSERFGLPAFRAKQLFQWVYQRGVYNPLEMSDLSKEFREQLASSFSFEIPTFKTREISADTTRKYLFTVGKGDLVESVMIHHPERKTICVSSQVGCPLACAFCRTGTMGLKRNLTTAEIVGQFLGVRDDAKNFGDMYSNVVFMGMGEPFHNYDNVIRAIRIITSDFGLAIAPKRITVSTAGLVPKINEFVRTGPDVNLAISLNATYDKLRDRLMPINLRYPLAELVKELREAPLKPRKWFTIEYVLMAGVNDTDQDLDRLHKLLHGVKAKINLIPYNANAGQGFAPPDEETLRKWQQFLIDRHWVCTIRWSKGKDINAACGQLKTATAQLRKSRPSQTAL